MRDSRRDLPLLRRILASLRDLKDAQIVVSTGNEPARAALAVEFPHAQIFTHVPQLSVLKCADLVLTHGGWNTVRECICAGVPMLAFPRQFDQPYNCARIEYLGLGLRGSRYVDTRASILRKVRRVLGDSAFRERVRDLSARLAGTEPQRIEAALSSVLQAR